MEVSFYLGESGWDLVLESLQFLRYLRTGWKAIPYLSRIRVARSSAMTLSSVASRIATWNWQVRQWANRLSLVLEPGDVGPKVDRTVDLLYIDTSHECADTIRELQAWRPALREGALVVFDDFAHPEFPGVREAILQLGLEGEERDGLFVHRITSLDMGIR